MEELNRIDAETFKKQPKQDLVVVLDNIRSLHNVGSIFRTCDAFAVAHLYLCGITGTPPHREIHRSALGAEESVDWSHHGDTASLLETLKKEGWTIVALEQTNASLVLGTRPKGADEKWALVFGNEAEGVSEEVLAQCDLAIEIPQLGTKHSFNVSVTAGIVLWEISQATR